MTKVMYNSPEIDIEIESYGSSTRTWQIVFKTGPITPTSRHTHATYYPVACDGKLMEGAYAYSLRNMLNMAYKYRIPAQRINSILNYLLEISSAPKDLCPRAQALLRRKLDEQRTLKPYVCEVED